MRILYCGFKAYIDFSVRSRCNNFFFCYEWREAFCEGVIDACSSARLPNEIVQGSAIFSPCYRMLYIVRARDMREGIVSQRFMKCNCQLSLS